jgi:myo-inositol-1(or 4)-monophosphatase
LPKQLVLNLARALREHVAPSLGSHAGRMQLETGVGGDVTFEIDLKAEQFLEAFLREHAPGAAYYSEDRGLVLPDEPSQLPTFAPKQKSELSPEHPAEIPVFLVDPIDGTRPAMAGLESCCVSVAQADLQPEGGQDGRPTMKDIEIGCVVEIKTGATFLARRGRGVEMFGPDGETLHPTLSTNADVSSMFWTSGFRGRPAEPLIEVLGELIDLSSVGGGFFDLGSACFDLTRLLTGQLDAYLDAGPFMIDAVPALRERFEHVGRGAVLNNSPYDLAAAVLCLEEAGAVVTDARGEPLGPRPLLGSGHEFQMSCLAASNPALHSQLVSAVERGIERLSARYG